MILNANIKNEKPPHGLYDMIRMAGMNFDPERTIFTYGDAIYNPAELELKADIVCHECVHMKQQRETEGGPDGWWARYLQDPLFRIRMEAEAYGAQWAYFCKKKKSQNAQLQMLLTLSNLLSGPMYGNQITPEGATRMIREQAFKE